MHDSCGLAVSVIITVGSTPGSASGAAEEGGTVPGPSSPDALRTSELRRADGSLAARYRFRGRELVAFQWQDGGSFARAVDEAEYERLSSANVDSGSHDQVQR